MSEPVLVGAAAKDLMAQVERMRAKAPAVIEVEEELTDDEVRALAWNHRVWPRFASANLGDLDETSRYNLLSEVIEPKRSCLIAGATGVGKTHMAVAVGRELFMRGANVKMVTTVGLLDALRPGGNPNALGDLIHCTLIIDDIGAEKASDWTEERLYALANDRWLDLRQTIVTTNLSRTELDEVIGARTASRLLHDAFTVVLGGEDRRGS